MFDSSVSRTHLSDMGVGDELTVVGQVTRGVVIDGVVMFVGWPLAGHVGELWLNDPPLAPLLTFE